MTSDGLLTSSCHFFFLLLFFCVCVYACVFMCAGKCIYARGGQRSTSSVVLQVSLLYFFFFFKTKPLCWPGACWLGWVGRPLSFGACWLGWVSWPSSLRDQSISASQLWNCSLCLHIWVYVWLPSMELGSSCLLLTRLSPQPHVTVLSCAS